MNLLLRPLENPNDPVWSVIISIIILLVGVSYYIYTILSPEHEELNETEKMDSISTHREHCDAVSDHTNNNKVA
tara:strand:+ start:208 stop:429 length:222 start_codon:yes stop_codon:yes gene_type:complete